MLLVVALDRSLRLRRSRPALSDQTAVLGHHAFMLLAFCMQFLSMACWRKCRSALPQSQAKPIYAIRETASRPAPDARGRPPVLAAGSSPDWASAGGGFCRRLPPRRAPVRRHPVAAVLAQFAAASPVAPRDLWAVALVLAAAQFLRRFAPPPLVYERAAFQVALLAAILGRMRGKPQALGARAAPRTVLAVAALRWAGHPASDLVLGFAWNLALACWAARPAFPARPSRCSSKPTRRGMPVRFVFFAVVVAPGRRGGSAVPGPAAAAAGAALREHVAGVGADGAGLPRRCTGWKACRRRRFSPWRCRWPMRAPARCWCRWRCMRSSTRRTWLSWRRWSAAAAAT
jgi:hypothetical protein